MSWIVIASRAGARIVEKQGDQFSLVEDIPHDAGRLRDGDIESDRQGRSFSRTTAARHALETSESAHEHITKSFVRMLGERLKQGRIAAQFERLILVAEPHLLGLLRDALDHETSRRVVASVTKNLHDVALCDLPSHLPELPPSPPT